MNTVPIRIRLEAAGPSCKQVLDLLKYQADQFFADEPYWLDGDVTFEVESYVDTMQGGRPATRWAGNATYVNYQEGEPWLRR